MRKLVSGLLGLGLGAAAGALLVLLFAPASGQEIVALLQRSWAETMTAARQASARRRAELEAELAQLKQKNT
jgi:gas vesicle protein